MMRSRGYKPTETEVKGRASAMNLRKENFNFNLGNLVGSFLVQFSLKMTNRLASALMIIMHYTISNH